MNSRGVYSVYSIKKKGDMLIMSNEHVCSNCGSHDVKETLTITLTFEDEWKELVEKLAAIRKEPVDDLIIHLLVLEAGKRHLRHMLHRHDCQERQWRSCENCEKENFLVENILHHWLM